MMKIICLFFFLSLSIPPFFVRAQQNKLLYSFSINEPQVTKNIPTHFISYIQKNDIPFQFSGKKKELKPGDSMAQAIVSLLDLPSDSASQWIPWLMDLPAYLDSNTVGEHIGMTLLDLNEDGTFEMILQKGIFFGPSIGTYVHLWNSSKQKYENQMGAPGAFALVAQRKGQPLLFISYTFETIDPSEVEVNQVLVYDYIQGKVVQNTLFYFPHELYIPQNKRFLCQIQPSEYIFTSDTAALFPAPYPILNPYSNTPTFPNGSIAKIPASTHAQILAKEKWNQHTYAWVVIDMEKPFSTSEQYARIPSLLWHGMNNTQPYSIVGWVRID